MRGPHESPQAEFQEMCIEALQAAYEHLTSDQLTVLLQATGISRDDAFPWHSEEAIKRQLPLSLPLAA